MELIEEEEVNIKQVRFSDAAWYKIGPQDIIIGGAGGIGSWLAVFLGKIGHNLYIYDMDSYEEANQAGQLVLTSQLGQNKAVAISDTVFSMSGIKPETFGKYEESSEICPIMVCGFDNMLARKTMFDNWCQQEDRELYLDGRMTVELGQIFAVQKGQEEEYRKHLFLDNAIEEAPCSFKATSHCGAMTASIMTSILNNYLANKFMEIDVRDVPFQFSFELPSLNFETLNHE